MTYTIKLRRGTAADWNTVNPILSEGELGYELDTRYFKVGDGVTPWADLLYTVDADATLPDATGLPDGKMLATLAQEWVVVDAPTGGAPGTGGRTFVGYVDGDLMAATGTARIYNDTGSPLTITSVRASVTIVPDGAPVVIDVNKNHVSIFTTQANRPSIPSGEVTDKGIPDDTSFLDGDFLTVDVDAVGSVAAGSNLTVQIEVS